MNKFPKKLLKLSPEFINHIISKISWLKEYPILICSIHQLCCIINKGEGKHGDKVARIPYEEVIHPLLTKSTCPIPPLAFLHQLNDAGIIIFDEKISSGHPNQISYVRFYSLDSFKEHCKQ